MAKSSKTKPRPVMDSPRCGICGMPLNLYPPGWVPCPVCGRVVCRQCWGPVWGEKAFDQETCVHADGSQSPAVVPIGEKVRRGSTTDWSSYAIFAIVALLVLVILYLMWDLFF